MMTALIFFPLFLVGLYIGWYYISSRPSSPKMGGTAKAGKYRNRDGTRHITVRPDGGWSVDVNELLKSPKVQDDLRAMDRLYKRETIMALAQGKCPPNQVGGYGVLTKKKLIIEWNDEWQKAMDRLSEYHAITYEILFDLPIKEFHPPAGIVLTADEIVETYGRTEKSS